MKQTMKKTLKAMLMMVAFGVLIFFGTTSKAATKPPMVEGLKQTGATTDSITMEWTPVADADGYNTIYEVYRDDDNGKTPTLLGTTAADITTWTVKGEQCVSGKYYLVLAVYISKIPPYSESSSSKYKEVKMYTAPGKVQEFSMTKYSATLNQMSYSWQKMGSVNGYEILLQDSNGNILVSKDVSSSYYSTSMKFTKGVVAKASIRAYRTSGGTKFYGESSDYVYAATSDKVTCKRSKDGKKITVNWKKVTGATGYRVSISTKSGSGYKKVKELNVNKKKLVITKCGKKKLSKKQTYYIKVEYLYNVDGKKVTSPIVTSINSKGLRK